MNYEKNENVLKPFFIFVIYINFLRITKIKNTIPYI